MPKGSAEGVVSIIEPEPKVTDAWFARGRRRRRAHISTTIWLPLTVFAATRVFDFFVLIVAAKGQPALSPMPASPGYFDVITNWDGQWYKHIAVDGYPFPSGGHAGPNSASTWAFLPLFPMTVRGFMCLSGMGFGAASSVVNLAAGGAAMILMYKLLEGPGGRFLAASGVALICTFITAPLLQVAYSESLALLLVCWALLMIGARRYGWALTATVLLSLTRLITPALTIVVAVHVVRRLRRRRQDPLSAAEGVALCAVGLASIGGVWLWSGLVELRFGPGTDASARVQYMADHPALGWFSGLQDLVGWPGPAFLVVVSIALVLLSISERATGSWGMEVRTWLSAYPIFMLAVTPVTTGVLRYLLLAFPLPLLAVAGRPPRGHSLAKMGILLATCLVGLVLQVFWVDHSLVFDSTPGSVFMP